jgi:hypothetical protein
MLKMHRIIEAEAFFDFSDYVTFSFENVVYIVASIKLPCVVGKLFAAKLLDLIKLGSFFFELF